MEPFDLESYQFELPPELIAQHPAEKREASRLLVAGPNGKPLDTHFHTLTEYLSAGDVLVLNQTKVINARCFAEKENGVKIEVFFLGMPADIGAVSVLTRPAKRVKTNTILHFPKSGCKASVVTPPQEGRAVLKLDCWQDLHEILAKDGHLPLPPYIKREGGPSEEDRLRYQTVFAREDGAVAAPTAGLHFTEPLLEALEKKGVELVRITHHVGIGTFKPLVAEDIRDHNMDFETYIMSEESAATLNHAKKVGRRIIAVGTTSTRCLESNYKDGFHPEQADTNLYIYPGYRFKAIDALITNFHLPGSSLILLVSALMGHDRIMKLYKHAVTEKYRFYSYGDAMFLQPQLISE